MLMQILYQDRDIVVCVKPPRVLSTDEPGGMPELVREALGDTNVRTVHRLDRVVSGLMVLARNAKAASELSRQIRENEFEKEYLAIVHGEAKGGQMRDLLLRDKQKKMTFVVKEPGKDVQEAVLDHQVLSCANGLSRVQIQLITGRTHQIRAQFSSRALPLVGDRKYGIEDEADEIALWSYRLAFFHPYTKEKLEFTLEPPEIYPWTVC